MLISSIGLLEPIQNQDRRIIPGYSGNPYRFIHTKCPLSRCCWASRRGQGDFRGGAGDVNDARQRLHQLPADRQTVPGYRLPRSARRLRRPVARRRRCTRSPRSLTPPVVPGLLLDVLPAGLAVRGQRNLELVVAQLPLVGIIKMLPTGFLSAETAPITCVFLPPPRLKPPHCGQVGLRVKRGCGHFVGQFQFHAS